MSELTELNVAIGKLSQLIEKQIRQREDAWQRWREANPVLSRRCKKAALVYNSLLTTMIEEILDLSEDNGVNLNKFVVNELLDSNGPRLAHLNNLVQTLSQLGGCNAE